MRNTSSRRRHLLTVTAAILALVLTGCGTAVPDSKGMTVEQATRAIEGAGFHVGKVDYDDKNSGAVGAVIDQEPAAGKRAKPGSLVVLTVAGPPPVETPDLSGLNKAKAEAALVAAGLELGSVSESYNESAPAGTVASQTPSPGADAPKGSAVVLVISSGPKPVPLPQVKGMTQEEASKALEAAGFKVKIETKADAAAKGIVISKKPADGEAQPGSVVVLTVSSGLIKVPNVVSASADWMSRQAGNALFEEGGDSVMDAHDAYIAGLLKKKGLRSRSEWVNGWDPSSPQNPYQTPKAGRMVPQGTVVRLVIPIWD